MTVEVLRTASADAAPGTLHVPAETRRTRALLEVQPVLDELDRRADLGLGAILSSPLLGALRQLPVDLPVPIGGVGRPTLRMLTTAPAGCVEVAEGYVVRRAVAPLRVVSAGVCASSWADGLRQASRFASYCSRYAVMTGSRFNRDRAMMEARYYGIGLATMADGAESFSWLVHPEPFRSTRETAAFWHFAESALDAFAHSPDLARG